MTLLRACRFFVSEACVGLLRSWRVSLLASLAIAISLFMVGLVLLVGHNLDRMMAQWRSDTRIVVYLDHDPDPAAVERVRAKIDSAAWVTAVEPVSSAEARERFAGMFPSLAAVLDGWDEDPLPMSVEIAYRENAVATPAFQEWLRQLRADPLVAMLDDDRDWLRQLEKVVSILRGTGLFMGAAMLTAAILTIGSVIRLTVHLHREEIATLRLVGATEFYIRGPFYFEGLLQGTAGGLLAVALLWLLHRTLDPSGLVELLGVVLLEEFLPFRDLILLVGVGGLAGWIGAMLSLRREVFDNEDG